MYNCDILILGAGITGLSCAAKLAGKDYMILEKNGNIGGYCATFYQDDFVWDCAGHFFHFSNPEIKEEFSALLSQKDMVYNKKNTKIFYNGEYVDYPFQYNIHQLPKSEFIECLIGLYSKGQNAEETFKDMLYEKFGKGIAEKFLIPYNTKLYACNLDKLDKEAMGRFFPYAKPEEIIRGFSGEQKKTYNDTFFYSEKGAVEFVNHIAKNVEKNKILTNEKITKIDVDKKIVYTEEKQIKYKQLISTIPMTEFLRLAGKDSKIKLSANKVLVFNFGFDKPAKDSSLHWIYFPGEECFYRVGFYNNILHKEKLSIYVEIGFNEDDNIDIEYYKQKTLEDLKSVGIIDDHKKIAENHIVMDPAYVHISSEGEEFLKNTRKNLEEEGIYFAGRYGLWTYCSIEDCIVQAYEVVGRITGGLDGEKTVK